MLKLLMVVVLLILASVQPSAAGLENGCEFEQIYKGYWQLFRAETDIRLRFVRTFQGAKVLSQFIREMDPEPQGPKYLMFDALHDGNTCIIEWTYVHNKSGKSWPRGATYKDGELHVRAGSNLLAYRDMTQRVPRDFSISSYVSMSSEGAQTGKLDIEITVIPIGTVLHINIKNQALIQVTSGPLEGVYLGDLIYESPRRPGAIEIPFQLDGVDYSFKGQFSSDQGELSGRFLDAKGSSVSPEYVLKKGPSFWDTHDWENFTEKQPKEGTSESGMVPPKAPAPEGN